MNDRLKVHKILKTFIINDHLKVHEILKIFDYKWSSKSSQNPKFFFIKNDRLKVHEILKI